MPMEETFEKLRALQDILSQKIKTEREVNEIPRVLVTQEELLSRLKKSFIDKNLEVGKSRDAAAKLREQFLEAEAQREKSEKNMDVISTQREYEALDRERKDAADKEQQFRKEYQREEKILAELEEQLKQSGDLIEQQEQELAERKAGVEAEIAERKARLAELEAEEKALTPGIDPETLFKFERIIRNKKGQGIVAIRSGVCSGCHMVLPVQYANDVREGLDILFCPYCSRILFYEESEGGEEAWFDPGDSGSLSDLDDLEDEDFEEEDEEAEEEERTGVNFDE